MQFKSLLIAGAISTVSAQNSTNSTASFCDKYTTALFMENTGENQLKLLTAVVNTAVIGNYSETKNGVAVAGILANGTVNGIKVNLAPYFNGGFASTNTGGSSGMSVNFLDGGGAAPLMKGMAANSEDSKQYGLLTHLYEYFGALLGCSASGFPAYEGESSQYDVHKFMNLHPAEVTYFINQVAGAALSFGVAADDLTPVGKALMNYFGYKCLPAMTIVPSQGPHLQSICSAEDCPTMGSNSTCPTGYDTSIMDPNVAVVSLVPGATATGALPSSLRPTGTGTASMTATGSSMPTVTANAASNAGVGAAVAAAGVVALFL